MPPKKKARLTAGEEGDRLWYINAERQDFSDLVLCCSSVNNRGVLSFTRIEVEKSFLKCHSNKFMNRLADVPGKNDQGKLPEVGMDESPYTVVSFLNILYSMPEDEITPFDHWVLVIEMGMKYECSLVVDRAIWYACVVFRLIATGKANFSVKYGRATAVKLLTILGEMQKSSLNISKYVYQEIHDVFYQVWPAYSKRCGIEFPRSPECACGGCEGPCCHHKALAGSKDTVLYKLEHFFTGETIQHFSTQEVFFFQQALDDYMKAKEKPILSKIYLTYLS
ncbi:uncharacterized protein FA14DRAFT_154142 [Meira miltonrushii]|uniref:BTB domain-containing protein n=1 Tax=Meira miltonrushii TaxID=1280837 RepID=A0A316VF96_9BASI|nr:uncharacterized protein FA14DRAFT_154142 [Meira miltonrushii]PWN34691.1 hypothetical protein FA14DRAFT_154142 [Meira miltonrushii]